MMIKATINRLATGVAGFDAVLGGGLPEFSFNLLAGPPGSGKTTLAHQLMFSLATPERSALYFTTLGESPLKMLRYQQQFAFFNNDQVNRSVRFISLGDDTAAGDVGSVLGRIAADGLIWLRQTTQRNSIVRKMEIAKMRGRATAPGLHTFRIDVKGLEVSAPTLLSAPDAPAGSLSRLHMGIPGLDQMMGGGLPRGYTLLVAGPSGSGKSILAASFLAEGARSAETGVIAAFEQRPHQARGPIVADLIATGRVGVIDTRTPTLLASCSVERPGRRKGVWIRFPPSRWHAIEQRSRRKHMKRIDSRS